MHPPHLSMEEPKTWNNGVLTCPVSGSLRAIHSFLLEDQSKVDKAILKEEKNRKEKISKMRNETSQKKL
jgi:hypothetical protein